VSGRVGRLILLNGPPGSGKSTLAQLYVDDHPLALNLDVDRVRDLLGRWRDHEEAAGLLARGMALAMARVHLLAGHDVVIPQYLGRLAFIEQVEQLAAETAADFHEVVLMDDKESALQRFLARASTTGLPAHREAQEIVARDGGVEVLGTMYDRLVEALSSRPGAKIVRTEDGKVAEAYAALLAHLS